VTAPRFDPVIHAPNRLQICAMLATVDEAEFGTVRDTIGVSDSVLSKHVRLLEEAGYVALSKATIASRQRTWLSLTPRGRAAFRAHVSELERLVAGVRAG
jgi:DNA-binding MarR family transcriptional regulator